MHAIHTFCSSYVHLGAQRKLVSPGFAHGMSQQISHLSAMPRWSDLCSPTCLHLPITPWYCPADAAAMLQVASLPAITSPTPLISNPTVTSPHTLIALQCLRHELQLPD